MKGQPAEQVQVNFQKKEEEKSDQLTQEHHILTGIIIINLHQVT